MFYRLLLSAVLLAFPFAQVHAAYQEKMLTPSPAKEEAPVQTTNSLEEPITPAIDWNMSPLIDGIETDGNDWQLNDATEMTRGAFTAALVQSLYTQAQIDACFGSIAPKKLVRFSLIFTDVTVDHEYSKEICVAMRDGIIRGYADGSFVPDRKITFAEGAKMLSRAYVLAPFADTDGLSPWYAGHVRALVAHNAVPVSITGLYDVITTEEATEMFDRLQQGITWRPTQKEEVFFAPRLAPKTKNSTSSATWSPTPTTPSTSGTPSKAKNTSSAASEASTPSSETSFWDLF